MYECRLKMYNLSSLVRLLCLIFFYSRLCFDVILSAYNYNPDVLMLNPEHMRV